MKKVWINARFLERKITGVERVAFEILSELSNTYLDENGRCMISGKKYEFILISSKDSDASSPWSNLPLIKHGSLNGHLWEQVELPFYTKGDLLLNLCNTAPILKREQICFIHDAQVYAIPDNFSLSFKSWYQFLLKYISKFSILTLVNSRFTASELNKYLNLKKEKIMQCRFGAEHMTRGLDQETQCTLDLPDEDYILAVSSSNPNKNFAAIEQALEQLGKDAPLCLIVGNPSHKHFKKSSVSNAKIRHLGYVSDNDLKHLYKNAFALVFPSFYEGFGFPPLEAMIHGCPVIASNTSSIPEVVYDAGLYCDPHNPKTISDAIKELLTNDVKRDELIQKGLTRSKHFTWKNSAEDIIKSIYIANNKFAKLEVEKVSVENTLST